MLRELCNYQRKGQFTLIVNKCKKGHESGQEHVNNREANSHGEHCI